MSSRIRGAFAACIVTMACLMPLGCGDGGGASKTDDSAEVEKLRIEHQDMSQREMANEG